MQQNAEKDYFNMERSIPKNCKTEANEETLKAVEFILEKILCGDALSLEKADGTLLFLQNGLQSMAIY